MNPLFAQAAVSEVEVWGLALVGSAIPALAWLVFFYTRDRYQREPKRLILLLFLVGAIPVGFLAGLVNFTFLGVVPFVVVAVVVAPVGEEILKYLGMRFTAMRNKAYDEPIDGMVYGSTVGLGFGFAENFDYLSAGLTGSPNPEMMFCEPGYQCYLAIFLFRGLGTMVIHAVATGIAGHFLSQRVFGGRGGLVEFKGVGLAILVHAAWNGLGLPLGVLIALIPGFAYYLRLARRDLAASPHRLAELDDSRHRVEHFAVGAGLLQPCENCNHLNRASTHHCTMCGRELLAPFKPHSVPCGACGQPQPATARFCSACGSNLS